MKYKLMLLLGFSLLGLSYGCKKELGKIADEPTKVKPRAEVKAYNPYSVGSMREALSSLMMKDVQLLANNKQKYAHGTMVITNSSAALAINKSLTKKESVVLVEQGLSATHYYIKFMPANDADYAKLKVDSNLVIYPFPLDAAVSQYSGSYRDPSLPAGVPTYQYASVPVSYMLPDVPYVKLSDLYLPNEQEPNSLITLKGSHNSSYAVTVANLVNESLCIGNESGGPPNPPIEEEVVEDDDDCYYGAGGPSTGTDAPAGEWRPSGRITMNDDSLGIIGVEGIKVRARRWFTTYTGITDADGYYHVDGTYTRPANYWLDFERYDFSVNDHHGGAREVSGPKMQQAWNVDFTGYDKFCAEIFRAAHHYYYRDIQGLRRPPLNSFWETQVKIAAFDWYENSDNGDMWAGRNDLLGSLIHIYHPQQSSMDTYATTIHELAHAVHWDMSDRIVGSALTNYGLTELKVCESWARGVQWVLTKMEYPNYKGGGPNSDYTNIAVDMIDNEVPTYPYHGSNRGLNGVLDLVEGYNIVQIQDALRNQTTWSSWKNNIKNLYTNGTENNLDALFTNWGNF